MTDGFKKDGEIKTPRIIKEGDQKIIIVGGFATCGTHSLVKYLKEVKGRQVILMEGFFQRTGARYSNDDYEIHFITRENCPLGYSIEELTAFTKNYPDCDVKVVRLEDMKLLPNFPHENKTKP